MSQIDGLTGMKDLAAPEIATWQWVERVAQSVFSSYGYEELRFPILERTELFKRVIGEVTDIVEKEMYTFTDLNGSSISLRPEGTASCVRAMIKSGKLRQKGQKIWYQGPMFRHEKTQKGRNRQFYQLGIEAFGWPGPDIDVETILVSKRIFENLNLQGLDLQVNTLGTLSSRNQYKKVLVDYFRDHFEQLDEDSQKRLDRNPLRILDSKNKEMAALIEASPSFMDFIDEECQDHFAEFLQRLDAHGIAYSHNHRLVRGLDYYNRTVFEWQTDQLGSQSAICAGGRYDGLVEQLGGQSSPAIGFAMGLDRIVDLIKEQNAAVPQSSPLVYIVNVGTDAEKTASKLAEELRSRFPGEAIIQNLGMGSFKAQMKRADRSQAKYALILGEDEVKHSKINLKDMRQDVPQREVPLNDIGKVLKEENGD